MDHPRIFDLVQLKQLDNGGTVGKAIVRRDEFDDQGAPGKVVFANRQLEAALVPGVRVAVDWSGGGVETRVTPNGETIYRLVKWTNLGDNPNRATPWSGAGLQPAANTTSGGYGPNRTRPGSLSGAQNNTRSAPYENAPSTTQQTPQIVPISSLNPYLSRYTIRARCVEIGDIRKWSNARGEGQLMKVTFGDRSGEIPAAMFGNAVDKFRDLLKEGHIYNISKAKVKTQNEKFRQGNHPCELNIDENSLIEFVQADDDSIPKLNVSFIPISEVESKVKGDTVDVCGVLIGGSDLQSIMIKSTGIPKQKRDVTIIDSSQTAINVCLWADDTAKITDQQIESARDSYSRGEQPVIIAVKTARVDEYNGKNLTKGFQTKLIINPDLPETDQLRRWYTSQYKGQEGSAKSLSGASSTTPWMNIAELHALPNDPVNQEGLEGKGVWFMLSAIVKNVNLDGRFYWESCKVCGKKVQDGSGDTYSMAEGSKFCAHCNRNVEGQKKWVCRMEVLDASGILRLTAMGDKANQIMKSLCDDTYKLSQQEESTDDLGRNMEDVKYGPVGKKFHFKCVARNRLWQDQKTVDYQVADATEITEMRDLNREGLRLVKVLSGGT